MYQSIIKNYIKKISIEDIKNFSLKNNIFLSESELSTIYQIIKNESIIKLLLEGHEDKVFKQYQNKFQKENLNKIKNLFYTYKNKFL